MTDFTRYNKIARWNRLVIVTEKLDGTNGAIVIEQWHEPWKDESVTAYVTGKDGWLYAVSTQSRNRFITPGRDNYGFARWVADHADLLVATLGEGVHFGEWWGQGIQRKYGMQQKVFSLFNTSRWADYDFPEGFNGSLRCVPVLGILTTPKEEKIQEILEDLRVNGSVASPGFMRPEGIILYHVSANTGFKITLENDDIPKSLLK